jgi:hypothetical protein
MSEKSDKNINQTKLLNPKEEEQREDEQFLAKNASDIEEILSLVSDKVNCDELNRRLTELQGVVGEEKQGTVFHSHSKGKIKIPLHHHTSNLFKLSEALELRIKAGRHDSDHNKALEKHLKKRIEVLWRIIERGSM